MAYNAQQLDSNCKSQRARKVDKRGANRVWRANVKAALRKGIDAMDEAIDGRRRYNGYSS